MIVDIVMPFLSETMEDGTVAEWLVEVGDRIAVGEDMVEIEGEKATVMYQSDTAGLIVEISAMDGATVACGEVIARVETSS